MRPAAACPPDFTVTLHHKLSDGYETSKALLARVGFDGTLELLTSGWEGALGYGREELEGRTLQQLMWFNRRSVVAAVAAILDDADMAPVDVRLRCRQGAAKGFKLHRNYDRQERMMYIVAEESPAQHAGPRPGGEERRVGPRG